MPETSPINLSAVRASLARLADIARAYPGLLGDGADNREAWEVTLANLEETMGRPPGAETTHPLAIRIGDSLMEAVDAFKAKLAADNPGFEVSRNDAFRRLLMIALDAEGMAPKTPKKKARKG